MKNFFVEFYETLASVVIGVAAIVLCMLIWPVVLVLSVMDIKK